MPAELRRTASALRSSKRIIESVAVDHPHLSAHQIAKRFDSGAFIGGEGRSYLSTLSVVRRFRDKTPTSTPAVKPKARVSSYAC